MAPSIGAIGSLSWDSGPWLQLWQAVGRAVPHPEWHLSGKYSSRSWLTAMDWVPTVCYCASSRYETDDQSELMIPVAGCLLVLLSWVRTDPWDGVRLRLASREPQLLGAEKGSVRSQTRTPFSHIHPIPDRGQPSHVSLESSPAPLPPASPLTPVPQSCHR